MLVLGVDPGSRNCGWGLLEVNKRSITAAGAGVIKLPVAKALPQRLVILHDELQQLIAKYKPDAAAVETVFHGINVRTGFILGQARGVIVYTLASAGVQVYEYAPREVKKSVVGKGSASKQQVAYMMQRLVPITDFPTQEDATDALAIAYCHFNKYKYGQLCTNT